MKVWLLDPAQLTPYYNIALGGALARAGCQVRYIASEYLYDDHLPFPDSFQTDYLYFRGLNHRWLVNYPRLRRALRGISYPFSHWRLSRQAWQSPPDVLHIQWSRVPRFDRWLIRRVQSFGVPVAHTVHDVIPLFAPAASNAPLQAVYASADRIILHTEANRRDFLQAYPAVRPERLRVIPLITTPNTAIPPGATQALARQKLNLPAIAPILVFFGSIRDYKGLDILLPAFAQALAQRPDLHLVIAGRPETQTDKGLLETAKSQPNVHVYSGYIPYEEVWQYHLAADVMVLPYRAITQSAALLSSMEFGRAVIVTDVGGLPETIEGNGWVVPPEDAPALAAAMLDAASNPERLRQMGARSAELARTKYAGEAIAQATIAVYRELTKTVECGEHRGDSGFKPTV